MKKICLIAALALLLSVSAGCADASASQPPLSERPESAASVPAEEVYSESTFPVEPEPEAQEMRPEFVEAMESYEAFYDEYCAFMQKFEKNPEDLELLARYAEVMVRLTEVEEAFEAWDGEDLNDAELRCYMEVNARVVQKLAAVAG